MRRRRLSGQTGPGDPGGEGVVENESERARAKQLAEGMGWEEGEAGPSDYAARRSARATAVQARREEADAGAMPVEEEDDDNDGIDDPTVIPRSYGRTGRAHLLSTFVSPLLLPFLPSAFAAPPRTRQPRYNPAFTPPMQLPREERQRKRIKYPDAVNTPSLVPTSILIVEETSLPYVLTQGDDGRWRKDERGWLMYGRQGKVRNRFFRGVGAQVTQAFGLAALLIAAEARRVFFGINRNAGRRRVQYRLVDRFFGNANMGRRGGIANGVSHDIPVKRMMAILGLMI